MTFEGQHNLLRIVKPSGFRKLTWHQQYYSKGIEWTQTTSYNQGKRITGLTYTIDVQPGQFPWVRYGYMGVHAGSDNQNIEVYHITDPLTLDGSNKFYQFYRFGVTNWDFNGQSFGQSMTIYKDANNHPCFKHPTYGLMRLDRNCLFGKFVFRINELLFDSGDVYKGTYTIHFRTPDGIEYPITDEAVIQYVKLRKDTGFSSEFDGMRAYYRYDGSEFDLYLEQWDMLEVTNEGNGQIVVGDGSYVTVPNTGGAKIECTNYDSGSSKADLKVTWATGNETVTGLSAWTRGYVNIDGTDIEILWNNYTSGDNKIWVNGKWKNHPLWPTSEMPLRLTLEEIRYYDTGNSTHYTTNPRDYQITVNHYGNGIEKEYKRVHTNDPNNSSITKFYFTSEGYLVCELDSTGNMKANEGLNDFEMILWQFEMSKFNPDNTVEYDYIIRNDSPNTKQYQLDIYVNGSINQTLTGSVNGGDSVAGTLTLTGMSSDSYFVNPVLTDVT